MGFLALAKKLDNEDLEKFPDYKHYFDPARWDDLISMFRKEM